MIYVHIETAINLSANIYIFCVNSWNDMMNKNSLKDSGYMANVDTPFRPHNTYIYFS